MAWQTNLERAEAAWERSPERSRGWARAGWIAGYLCACRDLQQGSPAGALTSAQPPPAPAQPSCQGPLGRFLGRVASRVAGFK